jgi:hypothetical protein
VIDEDRFVANAGGFTMHMNHWFYGNVHPCLRDTWNWEIRKMQAGRMFIAFIIWANIGICVDSSHKPCSCYKTLLATRIPLGDSPRQVLVCYFAQLEKILLVGGIICFSGWSLWSTCNVSVAPISSTVWEFHKKAFYVQW